MNIAPVNITKFVGIENKKGGEGLGAGESRRADCGNIVHPAENRD